MTLDEIDAELESLADAALVVGSILDHIGDEALRTICPDSCHLTYFPAINTWGDMALAGHFEANTTFDEISGMAAFATQAGGEIFLGVDDGGGVLAAFNSTGGVLGTVDIGFTFTDLEDIAIRDGFVYVADIGDNAGVRTSKTIARFPQPPGHDPFYTPAFVSNNAKRVNFTYSDGASIDAETLLVVDGRMYVITKRDPVARIYSAPIPDFLIDEDVITLTLDGYAYEVPEPVGATTPGNFVGGDVSPDGLTVILKTYDTIYSWTRAATSIPIPDLLATEPLTIPYVGLGDHPDQEPKGEAIAFNVAGDKIYALSEDGAGSSPSNFPLFVTEKL